MNLPKMDSSTPGVVDTFSGKLEDVRDAFLWEKKPLRCSVEVRMLSVWRVGLDAAKPSINISKRTARMSC